MRVKIDYDQNTAHNFMISKRIINLNVKLHIVWYLNWLFVSYYNTSHNIIAHKS